MDIYGVIGWPIKHSLSPAMHNAAFKHLDIDAEYRKFEVKPEELEDFLLKNIKVKDTEGNLIWSKEIVGFNITIPHKIRAREILDKKYKAPLKHEQFNAILTGAVNTVKRTADTVEYFNTDVLAFQTALREDLKFDAKNKIALLIGCGGAGRAIIAALSWKDIGISKIYVYDINNAQVESTKEHFSKLSKNLQDIVKKKVEFISLEQLSTKIKASQLLVNASPVGMKEGDSSPIDKKLLHEGLSIYDVIYNRKTQLIKDAELLKLSAVDGLGMFLYQGAHAFEFWTGKKAPIDVMRKALLKSL